MEGFDHWKLLAGLGIFLFGMFLMEESIKKLAGKAFKIYIRQFTTGKLRGIFSGMVVTSILQSSSAVSLMVLAFVGAGIMTMQNAIGVILGSNIGTTVTAWIVATIGFKMNIESFSLPLIGIGGLGLIFLAQSERYANISKLLVGFGFLFMGLDHMKTSVEAFADQLDLASIASYGIIIFLGLGILLTAIMQSSSATIAIVLTGLNADIITFNPAAAMIIGANIGTTITILLGAIGAVQVKKRVAFSHFTFNLVTGIVAIILMPAIVFLVLKIFPGKEDAVMALALFHTIFNVLGVLLFFPFIILLANWLTRIFPDKKSELALHIVNTTTDVAEAAITALKSETIHLARMVLRHNLQVLDIDETLVFSKESLGISKLKKKQDSLDERYQNIKLLQAQIFTFSTKIQQKELTPEEAELLGRIIHAAKMLVHGAKSFKDIKHNFEEFQSADNEYLNDQYDQFRKRLIESYLRIDRMITKEDEDNKVGRILKAFRKLKTEDMEFVKQTTQAVNRGVIGDIDVANALIVNRAFVQSSRYLLLAIKELMLNKEEIIQFDQLQELSLTMLENE